MFLLMFKMLKMNTFNCNVNPCLSCFRLFWTRSSLTALFWYFLTPKLEKLWVSRLIGFILWFCYNCAKVSAVLLLLLDPTTEFKGCVSGAAATTTAAQQQSSSPAGVHVSSPGVCHQHGLLQPLDRALIEVPVLNLPEGVSMWQSSIERRKMMHNGDVSGFMQLPTNLNPGKQVD